MTSQQIIIRLIDEKLINGEEAYTLLNDILKGEIVNCWETLNENSDKTAKSISVASPYWSSYTTASLASSGSSQ